MKHIKNIFELILILLIVAGFNFYKISPDYRHQANIISAILFLFWIVGIALSKEPFRFIKLSFYLILIRILIPIISIVFTLYFYEPPIEKKADKPIKLEQISKEADCEKIKYGTFTHDLDTIQRILVSGVNYEIHNHSDSFIVSWISDCSYRLNNKSGQFEIYRIREVTDFLITLERTNSTLQKDIVLQNRIN